MLKHEELLKVCKYYMYELWGEKFDLPLKISKQLTKVLGYFSHTSISMQPIELKFSYNLLANYKLSTIESVIKHELCHYHLFINKKPYTDGHPVFEKELKRIGGSTTNTVKHSGERYLCVCKGCGGICGSYSSKGAATRCIKNYRCGKCKFDLRLEIKINEDKFERIPNNIGSKPIEEVLKMTNKEIYDFINNKKGKTVKVANTTNKVFDITKYVEVTSKKPTQKNVCDTLVILVANEDIDGLNSLLNLYNKQFLNCLKYIGKKRMDFLKNNNIV